MNSPVVSLIVPTYNRIHLLRGCLDVLRSQLSRTAGEVEVIVSDNDSTDGTWDYLRSLDTVQGVRIRRNDRNIGAPGNILASAREAKGEFLWMIGDDDLLLTGTLSWLVGKLNQFSAVDLFLLNIVLGQTGNHPQLVDRILAGHEDLGLERKFRRVDDWSVRSFDSFIDGRFDDIWLGSMMCNVIRRSAWDKGAADLRGDEPFGTVAGTYPVCHVLAGALVGRPAMFLPRPAVAVCWGHQEWKGWIPYIMASTMFDVLDEYEAGGVESEVIDRARRWQLQVRGQAAVQLLFDRTLGGYDQFSLARFVRRFWNFPEAWRAIARGFRDEGKRRVSSRVRAVLSRARGRR